MINLAKTKAGLTLIEMLLYSAMLSIFIVMASVFVWDITAGKVKNDSQAEVNDNAQIAIDEITRIVRNAKRITTPAEAGASSPTLVMSMPDGSINTLDLAEGRLRLTSSRATRVKIDVILTIDVSGSMAGQPLAAEKVAANSFIDHLDPNLDKVGIVSFSATATLRQPLTSDFSAAKAVINSLSVQRTTNYQDGIQKSATELNGPNHREDASKVMVFMSDGLPNVCSGSGCNPTNAAKAAADSAKASGITIYTIGLMQNLAPSQYASARAILQYIASSSPGTSDHYFEAPTADDLQDIYNQIAYLLTATGARDITSATVASDLTQLSFTNVSRNGTPGAVRVQIEILRKNLGGGSEYNSTISIDCIISLKPN